VPLVAESSEFAIFDVGSDTHRWCTGTAVAVAWQGVTISGDGLFPSPTCSAATRALYRNVAGSSQSSEI
jgi:hypothetical protein